MDKAEEKVLKFRRLASGLYSKYEDLRGELPAPYIIATKGDPAMGRKLVAFYLAAILKCSLIKEHEFDDYRSKSEKNQASLWKKMCNLARCQLTLGRSVVFDTELARPNEFDWLKELSETTNTPLAVFEYRVGDQERLWNSRNRFPDGGDSNPVMLFFTEFIQKPTSQYNYSSNYNMGEIPRILIEVDLLWIFDSFVSGALKDFRDLINPYNESAKPNDCNHIFYFINIEDDYKRRCCQCKQLVTGSVFHCCLCRFIVHATCSYFPNTLNVATLFSRVTLTLWDFDPKLEADESCNCCKQLLGSSTNSRYYSGVNGLSLLDFDCLFLLPWKRRTKIHAHDLYRVIDNKQHWCHECEASIDNETIFYYCQICNLSFDVFCLWLPETVAFDRHRHSFDLLLVPRVDIYPYYCHVCEEERDTERWIYYCEECDFPIHPRCIVKMPCLPSYLRNETSTTNNLKEKLTDMEFGGCSSHLSTERVTANELNRPEVKEFHLLFKESIKQIELPIIIAVKGYSNNGKKLVSLALAAAFDCFLIDEDNLSEVTNNTGNEPKQVCHREISQIVLSQLQIGLSVVIDCDHSHESLIFILQDFSLETKTPLFTVECKQCDEAKLDDFSSVMNLRSGYEYNVGGTPNMIINSTEPTFDDIIKFMPNILHSISAYSREWSRGHTKEPGISLCNRHFFKLGVEFDVSEGDICNRCSKKLSSPILKCITCDLVLHKTCTEFPLHIQIKGWFFILEKYGDDNKNFRCDCCNELVKGYAYTVVDGETSICIDVVCLFTPPKPRINLHSHPIQLELSRDDFQCEACGYTCKQKLRYHCTDNDCLFAIGINCGLLNEIVPFDRHRHPFYLIISPEHVSNQYYCEVCQEERDKKHWVYCCVGCEYFSHIHCLVPTGGCPPLVP